MGQAIDHGEAREILETLFEEAEEDSRKNQIAKVSKIVEEAAEILFKSNTQSRH